MSTFCVSMFIKPPVDGFPRSMMIVGRAFFGRKTAPFGGKSGMSARLFCAFFRVFPLFRVFLRRKSLRFENLCRSKTPGKNPPKTLPWVFWFLPVLVNSRGDNEKSKSESALWLRFFVLARQLAHSFGGGGSPPSTVFRLGKMEPGR